MHSGAIALCCSDRPIRHLEELSSLFLRFEDLPFSGQLVNHRHRFHLVTAIRASVAQGWLNVYLGSRGPGRLADGIRGRGRCVDLRYLDRESRVEPIGRSRVADREPGHRPEDGNRA